VERLESLLKLGSLVDPWLERYLLRDSNPEFHEALLYPIRAGGKRLRPGSHVGRGYGVWWLDRVRDARRCSG
jgi:geranylgeranyl pyrophosphate synthase